ncbi:MAG TPA: FAD-dependent oxidoreductase, partial [Nocardioidaceae bacterium]|nr:FAD-dependent oxidoreductase [Nocardioidaceae bacterium]
TPLVACVWSCGPDIAGQYPARYLFEFLANHGMLSVTGSPEWRTVTGGSQRYVERAAKNLTAVRTATPVRAVTRVDGGVQIQDDGDDVQTFDAGVVATHPDQALALLTDPTRTQRLVLGAFEYSENPTLLHDDVRVLPKAKRAQASWNYLMRSCDASASAVEVSYDMNRLQQLATSDRYLVTLNDPGTIPHAHVIDRMSYRHPTFTPDSVAAQRRLPELNDGVLAFAGAYHGWGFHEDGCRSGVQAAESLGASW